MPAKHRRDNTRREDGKPSKAPSHWHVTFSSPKPYTLVRLHRSMTFVMRTRPDVGAIPPLNFVPEVSRHLRKSLSICRVLDRAAGCRMVVVTSLRPTEAMRVASLRKFPARVSPREATRMRLRSRGSLLGQQGK